MSKDLKELRDEWYARARASGFHDIEAPSGHLTSYRYVPGAYDHLKPAHLESARVFLLVHKFRSAFERTVWARHVEGLSNREIARQLGRNRKRVDAVMQRLKGAMADQAKRKKRGRPIDPDGLRSEGLRVDARLSRSAAMALDHIRQMLQVTAPEAVRRGLLLLANRITGGTKIGGQ